MACVYLLQASVQLGFYLVSFRASAFYAQARKHTHRWSCLRIVTIRYSAHLTLSFIIRD